jgi:hypothetical protein
MPKLSDFFTDIRVSDLIQEGDGTCIFAIGLNFSGLLGQAGAEILLLLFEIEAYGGELSNSNNSFALSVNGWNNNFFQGSIQFSVEASADHVYHSVSFQLSVEAVAVEITHSVSFQLSIEAYGEKISRTAIYFSFSVEGEAEQIGNFGEITFYIFNYCMANLNYLYSLCENKNQGIL